MSMKRGAGITLLTALLLLTVGIVYATGGVPGLLLLLASIVFAGLVVIGIKWTLEL